MLILILIGVQYSQKAVFICEKGLNHQNHSPRPLLGREGIPPPTFCCYLENPAMWFTKCLRILILKNINKVYTASNYLNFDISLA